MPGRPSALRMSCSCDHTSKDTHQDYGRALIRTEWPGDDAGVGQSGTVQRRKSLCQNVLELGDELRAGATPPHLHGILHALAEVVPDVLVARHLDPRVLVSLQPGLDAHDMGYLIVHGPSRALGGLREVVIAAGAAKIDDGVGEGSTRSCRPCGAAGD